ncbi:hypothetical protein [Nostoc sphaeroides]|uniref:Uncharacterized protein n=1 Tax=Nostoc sphaeroides CCNUC1 TaxID=2653204 RepID=A0A5P8WGG5_9NOSO|nr:hypothetical protein [Nostoc sphaeroides]QFS51927.1 hypothetical protein GXM_09421 [Nostoc sphaeroides CCNUC1]
MKAHKNKVALSHIFLHYLGLYVEVQDMSRAIANVKNFATTRLLSAFAANDRQQIYC